MSTQATSHSKWESASSAPRATFYAQSTPATRYLRCELPARWLPGQVLEDFDTKYTETEVRFPEHQGSAAIFQFPGDSMRALVAGTMREQGIRVLVEADDGYLLKPSAAVLRRSQWGVKIGEATATRKGHRWIVEHVAHGAICTSEALADTYRKYLDDVYVCPNTVDPADWPEPEKLSDGIFRIAWIASLSHDVDAPLIQPALEWASRQPGVEVYIAGFDPKWKFRYHLLPWLHELSDYRKIFQLFDVGVAPVIDRGFARFRSDVKALEYAMGLCCPVLMECEAYRDWIDHPCFTVTGETGFRKVLEHLVSNREEALAVAREAREYVLAERTIERQIHLWEEAISA